MTHCSQCGTANADGNSFCGSCGAFLWSPTSLSVTSEAVPPAVSPARPTPPDDDWFVDGNEKEEAVVASATATTPVVPPAVYQATPTVIATRCAECKAANPPDRQLCSSCGTPLRTDEQEVPAGAEGGLFPNTWGEHRVLGRDSSFAKRVLGILVLGTAVILILAVAVGPWRDPIWDWTRDRLADAELVAERRPTAQTPLSARASSTRLGLRPRLAIDGFINTYWVPGTRGANAGVGESLTVRFEDTTEIGEIQLATGIQDDITPFRSQPRPRDILISFDGSEHLITQPDSPGFHKHSLGSEHVTNMTFKILSVYPAVDGGSRRTFTAIAEIEFYSPL